MVLTEFESKLLLTLLSLGKPQMISTLVRKAPMSPGTLYRALNSLLEKNLVDEDRGGGARVVWLTEKGLKTARLLEEVERLLAT